MLNSDCLIDSDYDSDLALNTIVAFTSRHLTEEIEGQVLYQEKYQKEKIKTLTVALIICLNIDIDPPDVQKISPFSRVEAWFDPTDANSLHALETIGKNLQSQYERWQPRARYKQCLDPTLDDVKKLCLSLRRNAKDDRILFHYNGHGVPRPTENGEIWVFNTKFTKYIPLSLYDLQRWLGAPSVYVLDCQNAGRIIQMYEVFCERRKAEAAVAEQKLMEYDGKTDHSEAYQSNHPIRSGLYEVSNLPDSHVQGSLQSTPHVVSMENTIMLAACGKDEDLPQNPNLPADLFTACLTTPIRMALRWHWLRHQEYFPGYLDEALLDRIPGSHSNRMSLLGEINWIFTAVTDTIAWCSFPLDIFQKLFRQDLLIASLFRNFLLAERIMKSYGCQPVSAPLLLPTYQHSMWDAWDHTLDRVIHYLPRMLKIMEGSPYTEKKLPIINANPTTSGQLSHLLHHNYHQGNTVNHHSSSKAINTVNNHNNYNTSHRITGPVGNIPIDFCTNRTGHLCTQQQPQPPQGILTGGGGGGAATGCSGQLQRQTTTIPAFCLLPTRPHNSSNILPSNQILNDSTNFTVINPVVSVSTTTITSTLPSVSTGVSTTTVSKVSIPAPLVNHQNNQLNRQLNVENHLGSTNLHDVNDRSTVYQYNGGGGGGGGGGLPSNCRRSQFQTVSSQVSTLVPQSKTFKPIQSSVAPPPGFNLEQTKQQRRLEAEITNTVTKRPVPALIESEQHDICAVDKDDNNAGVNRDIIKTKSDSHDVEQKQQLQLPKLPKGNKSDHQSPEDHKITSHSRNANSTAGQNASPEPPTTSVLASNDENKKSTSNNTSSFGVDTSSVLTLINCHQQQLGEASTNDSTHSTEKDDAKSSEIVTNNQNVNQNKPKNMVTASPMKPQKQTVTNYPHGYEKLYLLPNGGDISGLMGPCRHRVNTKSIVNQLPPSLIPTIKTTALQPNTVRQHLDPRTCVRLPTEPGNRLQNHNPLQSENSPYINRSLINSNANMIPPNQQILLNSLPPSDSGQPAQMISTTVSSGSVIGGSGPASFFTSQMTAFKIWLQTADERRPPATQLPILLQILLSQSHRIRAMQLLSEFLDLGPWAVTHCLTVGIFPYIVRLFHSPVPEVKPYLVFIWGKIIASAQTEFGRNDSVRDFGYKYFITCLGDTENLSPLTRTITAFALAKMLEKDQSGEPDPFFQDVYLKQNFLPIVLTQLFDNTPIHDQEMHIRMRLWLILALAKLWCKNDEARWFGIRHNLPEVLLAYLNDISPEVRAATVYALGNLIENQTTDASKQDHADQISHEIGGQLVKISSRDASPLVRCMLVEAFRGLVKQFESQLCAIGIQYIQEIKVRQSQQPIGPKLSVLSASPCPIKRPMRHSTISLITPTSGSTGGLNVSRQLESNSSSYIYSNSNGLPLTRPTGREDHQLVVKSQSYYRTHVNLQQQQQQQASPILRKSFNNSASVFFTGSGNTPSTNIYVQFWLTLVQLAQDPYPEISRLATIIIQYLYAKIREKAEYQTICNPPNVVGGDSSSTLDTASTIVPLPDVYASNLHMTGDISLCTPVNPSIQKANGPDYVITGNMLTESREISQPSTAQSRSERINTKESSPKSTTPTASTSLLQTAGTAGPNSLIHSAQFPGRRHRQTDQRLRVSVTNPPNLPNTISAKNSGISSSPNTFVKSNGVLTSTSSGINNNTAPSSCSLDTVRTQFFAWSCRWFTRPLLSTYGQLNDDTKLKNHELSKSSGMDHELVSLGTISVDPDAVAYTDRVNRLRKQRKLSHLGRIQWELVAGEISCANTPMTNARSVSSDHGAHNNMTRSRISLRSSDSGSSTTTNSLSSGYLHPIAYYNCNASSNTTVSNTVSSIPTHVKFHPYQPHLVVVDSKKGVAIHSSKNLDHLHSIHTPVSSNSLFPELSLSSSSCVDGYPRVACVTDVEFINAAEEQSLLLTATDDGYIRVWRNYTHNLGQDPEILTAWIGITDLYQTDYPIGVVVHWNQQANQLSVSGDTRTIRIWDCNCESRLRDLNTGADTSVTCLTQSEDNNLLAAGFNDGGIRVWDLRLPSVHNNDNLVFNSQADSDRIYKVIFSPLNRLYAVGAMGGIGAWQLSSPTGSGSTCNTSTSGTCINNGRNSFSHHPRRCISTAVRSSLSSTNGIHNDNASSSSSSTTRRFRRLPCPPRLSLPMNSSVNCADLLVNLSSPHAHLTLAGIRGQSSISLHRIQDGSLHSSIKHYGHLSREQFGTPTCCAFHPNEPLIAAGFDDRTLLLLNVQNKSTSK